MMNSNMKCQLIGNIYKAMQRFGLMLGSLQMDNILCALIESWFYWMVSITFSFILRSDLLKLTIE